jgi:predicted nuclease of predicted toxin-antitoxin system
MLRLLIDENFNQRILRGLRLRIPVLDYVIVQETAMQGMQDPPLLREAAVSHRVLVTHDLKTVPRHAYARVAAGEPMPGIIAVPDDLPIGQAIEQLHIVVECAEENDLENQVLYLPL